jgi:undecaprenyl-diphosphatase
MLSAIFLGLIQGLTEFLPISSNAHLAIIGRLAPSAEDPGAAFVAITQIGTELAVLLYFRKDIATIVGA